MKKYLVLGALCLCFATMGLVACNVPQYGVLEVEPLTPDQAVIETEVGRQVELVLPTPGVGSAYEWTFEALADNAPVRFIEEKAAMSRFPNRTPENYEPDRIFVFEAVAPGTVSLVFTQTPRTDAPEDTPVLEVQRTFDLEVR